MVAATIAALMVRTGFWRIFADIGPIKESATYHSNCSDPWISLHPTLGNAATVDDRPSDNAAVVPKPKTCNIKPHPEAPNH